MVPVVWLEFPTGPQVSVGSAVAVSVTSSCFWGEVVSPMPNPQPGGPGAAFSLSSPLRPTRLG